MSPIGLNHWRYLLKRIVVQVYALFEVIVHFRDWKMLEFLDSVLQNVKVNGTVIKYVAK